MLRRVVRAVGSAAADAVTSSKVTDARGRRVRVVSIARVDPEMRRVARRAAWRAVPREQWNSFLVVVGMAALSLIFTVRTLLASLRVSPRAPFSWTWGSVTLVLPLVLMPLTVFLLWRLLRVGHEEVAAA